MKVRELIAELLKHNQEHEVWIEAMDGQEWDIGRVEEGIDINRKIGVILIPE